MKDYTEDQDTSVLSETFAIYGRFDGAATPIRLDKVAERHANGESLKALAEEVGTTGPTLKKRLSDMGLLVKPEDRNTPLNRLVAQIPHDEVIERYESGEPIRSIVASLNEVDIPATLASVEQVLDRNRIVRNPKPGEIPRGAPQGFSASDLPEASTLDGARLLRSHRHTVMSSQKGSSSESKAALESILMNKTSLLELAEMHDEGRGEPLVDLATKVGVNASVLRRAMQEAGYAVVTPQVSPGKHSSRPEISKSDLDRLAREHNEGKGTPISTLAAQEGVSVFRLKKEMSAAGYVVSSYSGWVAKMLETLADEIVSMYRDEELGFAEINDRLYLKYDLYLSLGKLRETLAKKDVPLRPSLPPSVSKNVATPIASKRYELRQSPKNSSDLRWEAIEGREDELAKRILKGEPVSKIAEELGTDGNWLARALKKTGHLPDVNLARLKKKMRLRGEL